MQNYAIDHSTNIQNVEYYVNELISRNYILDEYPAWVNHGFEIASLGEIGREYFHKLSQTSGKYDHAATDKKFDELLKKHTGKRNIGSFIYYCTSVAGISPYRGNKVTSEKNTSTAENAEAKNYRDYIITEEPTQEKGLISIGGVPVLSTGNVMLLTGPPKGRKTLFACSLINQHKLRVAYIDTEQGRWHSWRTGQFSPTADVFHLRGESLEEIMRVIMECVNSGQYDLIVIDNIRDLVTDFNNVESAGKMEQFFKQISERVPVLAILHENKTSKTGQGHLGYAMEKIAQTIARVQLADAENPAGGSIVECYRSRDEPFRKQFLSMDGNLSEYSFIGGGSITIEDFLSQVGEDELSREELIDRIAEIFEISPKTAGNRWTQIKKALPNAITERKEGTKRYFKLHTPKK